MWLMPQQLAHRLCIGIAYYRVPNISGISFIFFDHQTYLNQRRICLQNFTMDRELENQIRFLFNLSLKAEVCQCLKSLTKQT
jgi:hypothetical protein